MLVQFPRKRRAVRGTEEQDSFFLFLFINCILRRVITGGLAGSYLHGGRVQCPPEWFRKAMVSMLLCWVGDRHDMEKC